MNATTRFSAVALIGVISLITEGCAHVAPAEQHVDPAQRQQTSIKTAAELLDDYTRLVSAGDLESAFALFAPDAVFEFPFNHSIGRNDRIVGREEIRKRIGDFMANKVEGFRFREVRIWASSDPNVAFGEYSLMTTIKSTGRPYSQLYGGRLEARDGQIVLLREFSNPVETADAMLPGGLKDLVDEKAR